MTIPGVLIVSPLELYFTVVALYNVSAYRLRQAVSRPRDPFDIVDIETI